MVAQTYHGSLPLLTMLTKMQIKIRNGVKYLRKYRCTMSLQLWKKKDFKRCQNIQNEWRLTSEKIAHFTMSKVVWLHKLICALLSGSCHLEASRCIKWILDPDFSQPKLVLISPTSLSRNCQPRDFIRGPQDQSDQERRYAATRTGILLVKG
jgi:hypothetical protein